MSPPAISRRWGFEVGDPIRSAATGASDRVPHRRWHGLGRAIGRRDPGSAATQSLACGFWLVASRRRVW